MLTCPCSPVRLHRTYVYQFLPTHAIFVKNFSFFLFPNLSGMRRALHCPAAPRQLAAHSLSIRKPLEYVQKHKHNESRVETEGLICVRMCNWRRACMVASVFSSSFQQQEVSAFPVNKQRSSFKMSSVQWWALRQTGNIIFLIICQYFLLFVWADNVFCRYLNTNP